MKRETPPAEASHGSPQESESFFTAHRREMYRALLDRNVELASLYRAAIRELGQPIEDGEQASQVALVCHAMREFMLGLPGVVSADVHKRGMDVTTLTQDLPDMADLNPNMVLDSPLQDVPVPNAIARQLALIIQAERDSTGRIRANARLLLTGDEGVDGPQVKTWIDTYRYFQSQAHWGRDSRQSPLPTMPQLDAKITLIDTLMQPRVLPFIEQRPRVEDLLRQINLPVAKEAPGV